MKKEHTKFELLEEDENIRVFYKPGGMHSVSLKNSELSALSEYKRLYGDNKQIDGDECGLLYRLDQKTSGLLVFAKNNDVFNSLFKGDIEKTYYATCHSSFESLKGIYDKDCYENLKEELDNNKKLTFTSYFRNYEANSQFVRPVFEKDIVHFKDKKLSTRAYTTEIKKKSSTLFECKIKKGYRHQIRSTLSSLFYPIDGDINYGSTTPTNDGNISLVCSKLDFELNGKKYKIDLEKL